MKKIFTLITASLMALTAMSEDYTGLMNITLGGTTTSQDATISVTETDGKYTLVLHDFSFGTLNLGDITMDNMDNQATDGTVKLMYDGDITVPALSSFGPMPITLDATIDGTNVLRATIAITAPLVGQVDVTFDSSKTSGITTVTPATDGDVVDIYDIQGRKVADTSKKGLYILRKSDGTTTKLYKR